MAEIIRVGTHEWQFFKNEERIYMPSLPFSALFIAMMVHWFEFVSVFAAIVSFYFLTLLRRRSRTKTDSGA
jgi:hypothetical protein